MYFGSSLCLIFFILACCKLCIYPNLKLIKEKKPRKLYVVRVSPLSENWILYDYKCYNKIYSILLKNTVDVSTISYKHNSQPKKEIVNAFFVDKDYSSKENDKWILGECTSFARKFAGPHFDFHNMWGSIPDDMKIAVYKKITNSDINILEYDYINIMFNDGSSEVFYVK